MENGYQLTKRIFKLISDAKTIETLKEIENDSAICSYKMDINSYPQIGFAITKEEINSLINESKITKDNDYKFTKNITSNDFKSKLSPLEKLLLAVLWKNGDLQKVKYIVKGIVEFKDDKSDEKQENALVFYQFGKFLTKTGQPIIDQHVIRAFTMFESNENDKEKIIKIQKRKEINKSDKETIKAYKKWVKEFSTNNLFRDQEYIYHIDRILFALGKAIRFKDKKS